MLLVVLLGVTKVSEELRINLRVRFHTHAHSLHAASALAKRLLDSVLVVLDTLVTSSMMLLLHHSRIALDTSPSTPFHACGLSVHSRIQSHHYEPWVLLCCEIVWAMKGWEEPPYVP